MQFLLKYLYTMVNRKMILISCTGGLLTGLAWTGWLSGLILLISFVPAFYIENILYENRNSFHQNSVFVFLMPFFLIFNTIALGWVYMASIAAAIFIIIVSTFFMTFIIMGCTCYKNKSWQFLWSLCTYISMVII